MNTSINILNYTHVTRKGVPELRGFTLFECYGQKLVHWSSAWARILNVQD